MCSPALTATGAFPAGEPVFSIRYGGVGDAAAARELVVQLAAAVATMMIAGWMLPVASPRILSSYSRRVLFLVAIGLLLAVFSDPAKLGSGGLLWRSALLLAANDFISWTLAGLVVARCMEPPRNAMSLS